MEDQSNIDIATNKSYTIKGQGTVISTGDVIKDKVLDKFCDDSIDDIDFADVMVLDGITNGMINTITILSLWNKSYKSGRGKQLPRIVLLLDSMEVPEGIPLDMAYIHGGDIPLNVKYVNRDILNVIKNRTDDINLDYIIYCEDTKISMSTSRKLSKIPNSKIYRVENNSQRSKFKEINSANSVNRKIIITSQDVILHNNCIVFDTLMCKMRGESKFISKTLANKRAMYAKECVRLCDLETFKHTITVHNTPQYKLCSINETLAQIIESKISPLDLFSGFIEDNVINEGISNLKKQRMISNSNTLLAAGDLFLKLPLSHKPASIIYQAIEKSYPVFPFVVLAVIIEMGDTRFFLEESREEGINERLNIWIKYADEIKTLKPIKTVLSQWCKSNSIDVDALLTLCKTIITCFNEVETIYQKNFIIGKFSLDSLLDASKPLFHEVYQDDIYLISSDNRHYVDSIGRKFLLPDNLDEPPARIIALTRTHNKITSFLPDNSIYSVYNNNKLNKSTFILTLFMDTSEIPFEVVDMISVVFENSIDERMRQGDTPENAVELSIKEVNKILDLQFDTTESSRIKDIVANARQDIIEYLIQRDQEVESDDDEIPGLIPNYEDEEY
jgi:hypothetical protein